MIDTDSLENPDLEEVVASILTERLRASARLIAHELETSSRARHHVNVSMLKPSVCLFESKMRSLGLPQRVLQLGRSRAEVEADGAAMEPTSGLDTQQVTTFLQCLTLSEAQVLQERKRNLEF
eukprot:Blabericola_migrator_1__6788@NODE_3435_length_1778_cov_26_085330_g2135_i0_p2_GENE_NODE_3435_length_1778_cov_26_085330_g2135_i0NODE_3435_length_1778_cov_26_085330_g2135_i0_p2_ORF_typecomplete_len123_score13_07_NODE_3435_length_1778_cov_26_085330_g2135_i08641232